MKEIISLPLEDPGPNVDSKYRLCVLAAQRALQVIKGSQPQVETGYRKATSIALAEFGEGLVPYVEGEDAVRARDEDEELYRKLMAEARASYVDEEGNPLFGPTQQEREAREARGARSAARAAANAEEAAAVADASKEAAESAEAPEPAPESA